MATRSLTITDVDAKKKTVSKRIVRSGVPLKKNLVLRRQSVVNIKIIATPQLTKPVTKTALKTPKVIKRVVVKKVAVSKKLTRVPKKVSKATKTPTKKKTTLKLTPKVDEPYSSWHTTKKQEHPHEHHVEIHTTAHEKHTLRRAEHSTIPKREPLGHLLVEKILKEAGFHGGISSNKDILDKYSNDESIFTIRPQVVLQPMSQRDIEIAVTVLGKQTLRFPSLSLTPRAAGTGLGGGSLTDSIMIDVCTHMHHIHDVVKSKNSITITVQPGAMWRDV